MSNTITGSSSTGGLQRRRNANSAALDVASGRPRSASPLVSLDKGPGAHRSVSENLHHKIVYDERDLDTSDEGGEMPLLTLMEEVLLLGLKDKQGYLSFWNDNISYTLRGCILLELALRHRIAMVRDPNRRRFPLADRLIEVVDDRLTGEVLLDEALKMMKMSDRMSVGTWIDLLSGETWNVMKIGYQLKQVRERLAKGLVDKGVLRTEKRNFLLFDMATHPVSDPSFKDGVLRRTLALLTSRTSAVPLDEIYPATIRYRVTRGVAMVCAALAANVLENALAHLSYDAREAAFAKCDDLLAEFSQWPFGALAVSPSTRPTSIAAGPSASEFANISEITRLARLEAAPTGANGSVNTEQQAVCELHLEIVAAVCEIFRRMDSLL